MHIINLSNISLGHIDGARIWIAPLKPRGNIYLRSQDWMLTQLEDAKMVMVFEPTLSDLDWLSESCREVRLWLAVIPLEAIYEYKNALLQYVDHVIVCEKEQYTMLARDVMETITRNLCLNSDFNEIYKIFSSGVFSRFVSISELDDFSEITKNYLARHFGMAFQVKETVVLSIVSFQNDFLFSDLESLTEYYKKIMETNWVLFVYRPCHLNEHIRISCLTVEVSDGQQQLELS